VSRIAIAGDRCLVIEDAPNGVEAAQGAGCRVVGVTNSVSAEKLSAADRVVASIAELNIDEVCTLIDR